MLTPSSPSSPSVAEPADATDDRKSLDGFIFLSLALLCLLVAVYLAYGAWAQLDLDLAIIKLKFTPTSAPPLADGAVVVNGVRYKDAAHAAVAFREVFLTRYWGWMDPGFPALGRCGVLACAAGAFGAVTASVVALAANRQAPHPQEAVRWLAGFLVAIVALIVSGGWEGVREHPAGLALASVLAGAFFERAWQWIAGVSRRTFPLDQAERVEIKR
jgi:hypothetical protein